MKLTEPSAIRSRHFPSSFVQAVASDHPPAEHSSPEQQALDAAVTEQQLSSAAGGEHNLQGDGETRKLLPQSDPTGTAFASRITAAMNPPAPASSAETDEIRVCFNSCSSPPLTLLGCSHPNRTHAPHPCIPQRCSRPTAVCARVGCWR